MKIKTEKGVREQRIKNYVSHIYRRTYRWWSSDFYLSKSGGFWTRGEHKGKKHLSKRGLKSELWMLETMDTVNSAIRCYCYDVNRF